VKRNQAFKGKYLRGADLEDDVDLTIKDVEMQLIDKEDLDTKPVVSFEDGKPMVLNGVNWDAIQEMYGEDTDGWRGKKIRLWFNPSIEFGGKRVGGIRVRGIHELPEGWSKSKIPSKSADVNESDIPF